MKLMSPKCQSRSTSGLEIHRHFSNRLHSIQQQRDTMLLTQTTENRHVLNNARFIVREDQADQPEILPREP
jgi:hypothetical protein